jgi:hypothetical protein
LAFGQAKLDYHWDVHAIAQVLSATIELGLHGLLLAIAATLIARASWAWRQPQLSVPAPAQPPADAPVVTVQLPLRNEPEVAEDLLRCCAQLSWPRDRLFIQVLDDSDDETAAIVDAVAAELRRDGTQIEVVRRGNRKGYKAGALALGALRSRGDRFLVLDADFRPEPMLLAQLEASLGGRAFVQARWSYRNRQMNVLTRLQAAILDGLFAVEQARLGADGRPVQFNGTGGLWKRDSIVRAGGWEPGDDALTEDLDLSFRAAEAGEHGVTIPELAVSTELPASMSSLRTQQMRWVRGAGLGLRTLGRRALRRLSLGDARTMLVHLLRHARQPLFVAAALRLLLVAFGWARPVCSPVVGILSFLAVCGASAFYLAAARRRIDGDARSGALMGLLAVPLSIGLAPSLAMAFVGGAMGRRGGGFARTEKLGDGGNPPRKVKVDGAMIFTLAIAGLSMLAAVFFGNEGDWLGMLVAGLVAGSCAWTAL